MNKLTSIIIGVTIAIILAGSCLVPVIADAEDGQRVTYTNRGYPAQTVGDSDNFTYSWNSATKTVTIGTESITWSSSNAAITIIASDSGYLKSNYAATSAAGLSFTESAVSAFSGVTSCNVSVNGATKTITLSDMVGSSITSTSWTFTEWCFVPAIDGDMVMYVPYSADVPIYIEDGANTFSVYSNGGYWAMGLKNNIVTSSKSAPTFSAVFDGSTVGDLDGIGRYIVGTSANSTIKINVNDTPYYAGVLVIDKDATGIKENGSTIISLLHIIPAMVIISILASVAGVVALKRN